MPFGSIFRDDVRDYLWELCREQYSNAFDLWKGEKLDERPMKRIHSIFEDCERLLKLSDKAKRKDSKRHLYNEIMLNIFEMNRVYHEHGKVLFAR